MASRTASPNDDRGSVTELRRINAELRRDVESLRYQVEAEKQRVRDVGKEKLQAIKQVREQFEKERDHLVEITKQRVLKDKALAESHNQPRNTKERDEQHFRQALKRKDDELKQVKQNMSREREEAVRLARETTEARVRAEIEEAAASDRAKLISELFAMRFEKMRAEEKLEHRINSEQDLIAQMRTMKEEHRAEIEELLRKGRQESTRDFQQLRLAERILQAKDEELAVYEFNTQQLEADKESLTDIVANLKSAESWEKRQPRAAPRKNSSTVELDQSFAGTVETVFEAKEPLLGKVARLTAKVQSLEDRLAIMKSENAQLLKKKAAHSSASVNSDMDKVHIYEELSALRKRNKELEALNQQLQDSWKQGSECRSSRDMLRRTNSFQMKKQFSQQRAKERLDHQQELGQKDVELAKLREKVSCAARSSDDLQKKLHQVSVERLRSEKTIAAQIEMAVREVTETLCDRDRELAALQHEHKELVLRYDRLEEEHQLCNNCVVKSGVNNGYLSPAQRLSPPLISHPSLSSSETSLTSTHSLPIEQWSGSNEVDLPFLGNMHSSLDVRLSKSSVQSHNSTSFSGSRNLVCT